MGKGRNHRQKVVRSGREELRPSQNALGATINGRSHKIDLEHIKTSFTNWKSTSRISTQKRDAATKGADHPIVSPHYVNITHTRVSSTR
jgi:hypothetical protein